jgi:hypothetical protein
MRQAATKTITGFQARPGLWRVKICGKLHPSDFRDRRDIRLWYENMITNGLYKGHTLRFLD